MEQIDISLFDCILDKDEYIIKTIRPNKKRYCLVSQFGYFINFILFFVIAIIFLVLSLNSIVEMGFFYVIIGLSAAILLAFIWNIIYVLVSYKKTFYACTNKRIIIRSGFIGVDFKTLDINMIGTINVNVSFLDKLMKKNTGRISFGSQSSPMINYQNNYVNSFAFVCLDNPYDLYKEIKEIIDRVKKQEKEKN